MTPTPDQPRPDAAEMPTARQTFDHAVWHFEHLLAVDRLAFTDAVWDMLAEAGFVVAYRDVIEDVLSRFLALSEPCDTGLVSDVYDLQAALARTGTVTDGR